MKILPGIFLYFIVNFIIPLTELLSSNLYYTDRVSKNELQYDCLYYYVPLKPKREQQPFSHEIISYCYRPNTHLNDSISNKTESITFEELKDQKITIEQLFSWSAPIDLLERYQLYTEQPTAAVASDLFYNCSELWFGSTCQYTFDLSNDFADIVRETFRMKKGKFNDILNVTKGGTCYRFLECNRGPGNTSCLDWREVCDGKNDCFNTGIDEKGCFEVMELNECGSDEFRCQNGLCIPEDFLWEDSSDFDCLDGSDEIYGRQRFDTCYQDPAFRCEERTCRPYINLLTCGDGECIFTQIPTDFEEEHTCMNGRALLLSRGLLARKETPELSDLCWSIMICAMKIYSRTYSLFDTVRCEKICGQPFTPKCDTLIEQQCPPLFQFPAHPVIHGHVVLIHTNERPQFTGGIRKPKYICYNRQFCPKLALAQNLSSDLICIPEFLLNAPGMNYISYTNFITFLTYLFHQCPPIDVVENLDLCLNQNLFYCEYTLTCFSKYRLVDSVQDCLDPDDELEPCSMNDTYRFHCTSESDKCISPFCIRDLHDDCMGGEDEMVGTNVRKNARSYIPFQILCDGFIEYTVNINETVIETDETNCDLWPCDNQYTRCNIYFNCPNGLDEAHCEWTSCPPLHLPCVEPISRNVTCLPITLANDNITHCLGASDERHMCRIDGAESLPDTRYKCWNDTGPYPCISVEALCDGQEDCEFGDDEQFCQNDDEYYFPDPCNDLSNGDRTISHNLLCKLNDANKPRNIYFSLKNAITYPSTVLQLSKTMQKTDIIPKINFHDDHRQNINRIDFYRAWYCNRGVVIRHKHVGQMCLCPPSYYGDRCEFQSQRVSMSLQIKASEYRTMIVLVLSLIDDNQEIHSYEQLHYIPFRDCKDKFNIVLLYNIRPKDPLRKYYVQIQTFEKSTFVHRATWLFPIKFPVLPVYRLVKQLIIPADETHTIAENCPLKCLHGLCQHYANSEDFFCRCDPNWYGVLCDIPYVCQCSFDSRCVGIINNRSICICPPHKFGPRCLLTHSLCPPSNCHNRGTCIFSDERISHESFVCLCQDGFSGTRCENIQTKIDISFAKDLSIPQALLGHFITVYNDSNPTQLAFYKKVPFNLETVTFHFTDPLHILLIEFNEKMYLAIVQETFTVSLHISVELITSNRCLPIEEILDVNILKFHRLRYVKYYHTVCEKNIDLVCFYDESFMCLCNQDRFANCFNFDRSITYSCPDTNYCTNKGRCFQNSETCQTPLLCVCDECYYGKRCQLSTKGFGLPLDAILAYQIHPNVPLAYQPVVIKASIAITTLMTTIGFINSFLSIATFCRKRCRETGCGYYLFASSMSSFTTMIFLLMKFWILLTSQMFVVRTTAFLLFNCISMDTLLRISLNTGDWLNAAVAVERLFSVSKGINFNLEKSKQSVRWVFLIIFVLIVSTNIHDPIHRYIDFDEEEQRTWCLVRYSLTLQYYDSIMNIIHFLTPFSINIISAIVIIITTTQIRSAVRRNLTYKYHLREQFERHKYLLISPLILVLLGLPRLIISLVSGCMKSARDPWLFLVGYFVSYIPSTLIFVTFVLPSATYRHEFKEAMKYIRSRF